MNVTLDLRANSKHLAKVITLSERRNKIISQIENHNEKAGLYFPNLVDLTPIPELNADTAEPNDIDLENTTEDIDVVLPSAISIGYKETGISFARRTELELRISQADELLEKVRRYIAEISFLYRKHVRPVKSKNEKTRSYDSIGQINQELKKLRLMYHHCRAAMSCLGATPNVLNRYRQLKTAEMEAHTSIFEPQAGGRNNSLAWFWNMNVERDTQNNDYMAERKLHYHLHMDSFNWILSSSSCQLASLPC
jgi:hypothetical protein